MCASSPNQFSGLVRPCSPAGSEEAGLSHWRHQRRLKHLHRYQHRLHGASVIFLVRNQRPHDPSILVCQRHTGLRGTQSPLFVRNPPTATVRPSSGPINQVSINQFPNPPPPVSAIASACSHPVYHRVASCVQWNRSERVIDSLERWIWQGSDVLDLGSSYVCQRVRGS